MTRHEVSVPLANDPAMGGGVTDHQGKDHQEASPQDVSHTDGSTRRPRGLRLWHTWWRAWVFVAGQLLLAIGGLAYFVVWLLTWVVMVFAPGQYLARIVFPLGRTMAAGALASAVWVREAAPPAAAPPATFPPYPHGATASQTLWRIVRSRMTWRAYGWLALCSVALPFHLLGAGLFPLAPLWSKPWAAATVAILRRPGPEHARPPRRRQGPGAKDAEGGRPADAASDWFHEPRGDPARRGYGLMGMHERVAAVGGSLSVGPTPDGGFVVRATLPAPMEEVPDG